MLIDRPNFDSGGQLSFGETSQVDLSGRGPRALRLLFL